MAILRALVTFVAGVATIYFVGWIGAALLSATCAFWAGRRAWTSFGDLAAGRQAGLLASAVSGALIVGGIGFVGGFFGPMIFAPCSRHGWKGRRTDRSGSASR